MSSILNVCPNTEYGESVALVLAIVDAGCTKFPRTPHIGPTSWATLYNRNIVE